MSARPPGDPRIPPYAILFGPQANCTLNICPVEYSVYGYQPSLSANIAFICLFALAGCGHLYLGYRWQTWFFMGCMLVGCVSAILGYIGRVLMHYNPFNFAAFMLQITCVTTTPVYYCAAIYVTIALAIEAFDPNLSRFRPKLFYWIFIPCDLFSLVVQAAGGGLSTSSRGNSQTGVNLALVGLSFQVFTICMFCGFFVDYVYRYHRASKSQSQRLTLRHKSFFSFLALAILLITVRCVYRLAELHEGYRGELVRDEALFIWLEGFLILASVFALMLGHPGRAFASNRAISDQLSGTSRHELVVTKQATMSTSANG